MAIYSGFTHWKWWFSIVMLVYQRVPGCASHLVKGVWSIYCTGASINGDTPIAGWFIVDNSFKMDDLPPPILGNLQSVQPRHGSVTYIYIYYDITHLQLFFRGMHTLCLCMNLFLQFLGGEHPAIKTQGLRNVSVWPNNFQGRSETAKKIRSSDWMGRNSSAFWSFGINGMFWLAMISHSHSGHFLWFPDPPGREHQASGFCCGWKLLDVDCHDWQAIFIHRNSHDQFYAVICFTLF